MKRVLFGVLVFLAFIASVYADTSLYQVRYSDGVNTYVKQFDSITTEYDLYLDDVEVDISDYQIIHNIAYYGYNGVEDLDRITSQVMIWEYVYPNYSFEVINEFGSVVNLSYYRRYITRVLSYYAKPCVLDGFVSNIEYGDSITYVGEYNMEAYTADKYLTSISDKLIVLDNIGVGTHIVHFIVNENINNNKIIASSPSFGEFTTTINCLGNIINFNTNELAFIFDMYNTETGDLIGTFFIDKNNNYIEYSYGINITLVDVTNSTEYKNLDNITIIEDNTHRYNVNLNPEYYPKTIQFIAPLINENYNIINIDVFNTNNELIKEVRCKETCNIELPKDNYILVNNNTLAEYSIYLDYNMEFDLSDNYLKYLISEYKITEIIANESLIDFNQIDNIITLNDFISSNMIKIKIDNNYYDIVLDNLIYEEGTGLFKNIIVEIIDNNDSNIEQVSDEIETDYIEIDIPNTEDNEIWGYYFVKKKYYYNYCYSNYNVI